MKYSISFSKKALKELNKIKDPYYTSIKTAIIELENNPRPQGYIKLKGREAYRIRIADYRVIYEIFDSKLVIEVINLGHRKNIYK
jgi:mRNA interferase RelE/StbE